MRYLAGIVVIMAAIFIPLTAMAQSETQYVWILTEHHEYVMTSGETVEGLSSCEETGTRTFNHVFGNVTTNFHTNNGCLSNLQVSFDCNSSVCAIGLFRYTKNPDLEFTYGDGAQFSNTIVEEMDARPMTAFTQSSVVFQAGISGFMDNTFIKAMVLSIIGMIAGRRLASAIWDLMSTFKGEKHDGITEDSATGGSSAYVDDTTLDGSE